jgi:hypothetical protein
VPRNSIEREVLMSAGGSKQIPPTGRLTVVSGSDRNRTVPGSLTQRFFLAGEEQEATQYEHVLLEDDEADAEAKSSEIDFDSFDEVPRTRRPLLAVAGFLALIAVGVGVWKAGPRISKQTWWAEQWAKMRTPAGAPPSVAAVPVAAKPSPPVAQAETRAAPAPASHVVVASAITLNPDDTTPDLPDPPVAAAPPAKARVPAPKTSSAGIDRPAPLRGYVWSPAQGALVPADRAAADAEPAVENRPEPSAAPAGEPGTPPAATNPPAFQPGRPSPPAEKAPILE